MYAGPPWHLLTMLIGAPILTIGLLMWVAACARLGFKGRRVAWFLLPTPLVLVAANGVAMFATFWMVRSRIWSFGAYGMARPITTWSVPGWALIAAGEGVFLGLVALALWTLAPPAVDELD